jgi:hypothetical protein
MTEEETRAVIKSEGFRRHRDQYAVAFNLQHRQRMREVLAEVERLYGPDLAEGLAEWFADE